jgi:thiol-disulfide isomerase/thioredoxin
MARVIKGLAMGLVSRVKSGGAIFLLSLISLIFFSPMLNVTAVFASNKAAPQLHKNRADKAIGRFDGQIMDFDAVALRDLKGIPLEAEDYKNRKVVVYFWSIYCASCVDSLKELAGLEKELASQNTKLLTIHLFEPETRKINRAIAKLGLSLPIMQGAQEIRDFYAVRMLPTFFVVDENGKLVRRVEGKMDLQALRTSIAAEN